MGSLDELVLMPGEGYVLGKNRFEKLEENSDVVEYLKRGEVDKLQKIADGVVIYRGEDGNGEDRVWYCILKDGAVVKQKWEGCEALAKRKGRIHEVKAAINGEEKEFWIGFDFDRVEEKVSVEYKICLTRRVVVARSEEKIPEEDKDSLCPNSINNVKGNNNIFIYIGPLSAKKINQIYGDNNAVIALDYTISDLPGELNDALELMLGTLKKKSRSGDSKSSKGDSESSKSELERVINPGIGNLNLSYCVGERTLQEVINQVEGDGNVFIFVYKGVNEEDRKKIRRVIKKYFGRSNAKQSKFQKGGRKEARDKGNAGASGDLAREIKELKEEQERLKKSYEALEKRTKETEERCEKSEKEMRDLRDRVEGVEKEVREIGNNVETLKKQYEGLKRAIDDRINAVKAELFRRIQEGYGKVDEDKIREIAKEAGKEGAKEYFNSDEFNNLLAGKVEDAVKGVLEQYKQELDQRIARLEENIGQLGEALDNLKPLYSQLEEIMKRIAEGERGEETKGEGTTVDMSGTDAEELGKFPEPGDPSDEGEKEDSSLEKEDEKESNISNFLRDGELMSAVCSFRIDDVLKILQQKHKLNPREACAIAIQILEEEEERRKAFGAMDLADQYRREIEKLKKQQS